MGAYEQGGYSLGQGYVDPSDVGSKNALQFMNEFYQQNYTTASALWIQGAIDKRFKVGNQSLYSQLYGSQAQDNTRFFFNLIRRHVSMVCGFQRKNRKSTIALPINSNDDQLADDYNRVFRYCDDRDGFQEYLSQAFEGAVDTGETLLHLYPDYTYDPISGDLFTDAVSYNNYLIDQYSRKQDLSDCNGIWRRRWVSRTMAKMLLPGLVEEIDRMRPGGSKDGKFPLQAELQTSSVSNLFTYDEFYYRETRRAKIVLDPMTGEAAEWEQEEWDSDDLMGMTLAQQPWLQIQDSYIPTVKLIISLNGRVVYHGKNLLGIDQYPFIPVQCYVDQDIQSPAWRKQGIIRNLRDAQFLYNMRKVIELQMLQSSLNAGWIFPVDVVTDQKCFRQASGGDGFLIPLKAGHLPQEIQRIEPVSVPPSVIELSKLLAEDITKISGVNEELLGSATDDKAGILSMLRQGAGLTTLQTIFDKLDYSQRLYGKIRLAAIRKNFSKGKITQILNREPDPRFFLSSSQKFSIAVEEGNYSTTQRQTELQQLIYFKQLGINISDKDILRSAFLTNKKEIISSMEEATQQQQAQEQAIAQKQEQMDQAKMMQTMARAQVDMAKGRDIQVQSAERVANIGKIQSQAEYDSAKADLEMVKTMIQLEDMDLQNLKSNLELAEYIKLQNRQTQNEVAIVA